MHVERFTDQYALAAPLYERSPDELRRRDERRAQPPRRWLAIEDGRALGAVSALLRPDDRLFLSYVCRTPSAYGPLTEAATEALKRPVHTMVEDAEPEARAALQAAKFETEVEMEKFRISFEAALSWLRRAWVPSGFSIHPADRVDEDRLFTLDNTIRQDVPGTDGWRGNRDWFRDELRKAPPFDPSAYLVAIDDRTGEYAGLVRIWRNPDGPRVGLVGVVRRYRNAPIAAALLQRALTAASTWGHDTFTTETSLVNEVVYPRMKRLRAESLGRFRQLVRR